MKSLTGYDSGGTVVVDVVVNKNHAGAGGNTSISFENIQDQLLGLGLAVRALAIIMPRVQFSIADGKELDAASLAQLLASVSLKWADGSPPTSIGSTYAFQNLDGPRLLQLLHFSSGKPVIRAGGGKRRSLPVGASDQLSEETALAIASTQETEGWFSEQGPYGTAVAAGGAKTFDSSPVFFLPIGERYGEHAPDFAYPVPWLSGRGSCDCGTLGAPGELTIVLGGKVDNANVVYVGTTITVLAICARIPLERMPSPPPLRIEALTYENNQFRARAGLPAYAGIMKPLTAAGAMQTSSYTTVRAESEGVPFYHQPGSIGAAMLAMTYLGGRRPLFSLISKETATGNCAQARYTPWGVPLVLHDGQANHAPGSLGKRPEITVDVAVDTVHYWVWAGWLPKTPEFKSAAEKWAPVPGAVEKPVTLNGNVMNPATGIDAMTPGRTAAPMRMPAVQGG